VSTPVITLAAGAAAALDECVAQGGLVIFPTDTVYGIAIDAESQEAFERLYALKGRPASKPAAIMFFDLPTALGRLPGLGPQTLAALRLLLPGPVTAVLPNPDGLFPLACGPEPGKLGLRVPQAEGALGHLEGVRTPLLQSSANPSGAPDAHRITDIDAGIRAGVDLIIDGEELAGPPSTVVDLTAFEESGEFRILREGAVTAEVIAGRLGTVSSRR
jgi:L-threonylcarbamoyladenylate synthase